MKLKEMLEKLDVGEEGFWRGIIATTTINWTRHTRRD